MTVAILKPCAWPGCRTLTRGRHCLTHTRAYRARRQQRPIERIYDSPRWRNKTRPEVLARDKRCVFCGSTDRLHAAHVAPTSELLAAGVDVYDPAVCVTVCASHNSRAAKLGLREGWGTKNLSARPSARRPAPADRANRPPRPVSAEATP